MMCLKYVHLFSNVMPKTTQQTNKVCEQPYARIGFTFHFAFQFVTQIWLFSFDLEVFSYCAGFSGSTKIILRTTRVSPFLLYFETF
jgi:hypothetical protein